MITSKFCQLKYTIRVPTETKDVATSPERQQILETEDITFSDSERENTSPGFDEGSVNKQILRSVGSMAFLKDPENIYNLSTEQTSHYSKQPYRSNQVLSHVELKVLKRSRDRFASQYQSDFAHNLSYPSFVTPSPRLSPTNNQDFGIDTKVKQFDL
jgi:hypothetical protein